MKWCPLIKVCDGKGCQLTRPDSPSQGQMISENGWGDNGESGGMKFVAGETGEHLQKPSTCFTKIRTCVLIMTVNEIGMETIIN